MTSSTNRSGIVANAVAIAAAVLAFPFLLLPVLRLAFVGLLAGGPIAVVASVLAFLIIDVGPIVGIVVAMKRKAGALPWVTAALSLAGLATLVVVVAVAGTAIDLRHDGSARGAAPAKCTPASPSGAAVGRACNENGGPLPEGDCPAGYFCMIAVQGRPGTTCSLPCRHDCECPDRLTCKYERCVRP